MTIDRTALRGIAAEVHKRNLSVKFGDPRYSCTVGSDELLALVSGVPKLLNELDAKDRRIAELEAACQSARSGAAEAVAAHDVSCDLFSMVCSERDDALLRLSVATELNVGDRKRISELETQHKALQAGLREALRWHRPLTYKELIEVKGGHETQLVPRDVRVGSEWLHDVLTRLEKLVPSEAT